MASLIHIVEMLDRIKDGPSCTVADWDQKILPHKVREILKRFDLMKKFNPETPVNQDMELADRFFEAGLTLACELGLLCTDTETILQVTRDEILDAVRYAPEALTLGEGADRVVLRARKSEDKAVPLYCTSLSIQVDEDLYVPLVEGLVNWRNIDMLQGPSIDTVFGSPVFAGSPYETIAGLRENQLRELALWRAGRPGISCQSLSSATTEYGLLGGFAGQTKPHNPSIGISLQPAELKTNYSNFHKLAAIVGYGGYIRSGCASMIGGYSGPVEGTTVANIASELLQFTVNQASIGACSIFDIRQNSSCGRYGLWANSLSNQATSRNTHIMLDKIINQNAGPCTPDILYTSAAGLIATGVSGMALTTGPRSAGGAIKNYVTPLEAWFSADVFKATAGMTLDKANELVLYLLTKYEDNISNQPKGKPFPECFDLKTLKPTREWQGIADAVRADLSAHGLDI